MWLSALLYELDLLDLAIMRTTGNIYNCNKFGVFSWPKRLGDNSEDTNCLAL